MDQEHLERLERLQKEWEEKAWQDVEAELVRRILEAETARAEELPPWDKNNEELDYYDDVNKDTEMASSQETALASSQGIAPMSSQESKGTAPMSSQESMSQCIKPIAQCIKPIA